MRGRARLAAASLLLLAACDPADGEPTPSPCPEGEVYDDIGACVPEVCGTSVWGPYDRDDDVLHVAPDGDGDGDRDAPYGSIQDAIDAAGDGDRVLVAAGEYAEALVVPEGLGIDLIGRCSALVTLAAGPDEWAVDSSARPFLMRGMTVRGGIGTLQRGGRGTYEELVIEEFTGSGFSSSGRNTRALLRDVHVRDSVGTADGVLLQNNGSLEAERLTIERVSRQAISGSDGGSLDLRDLVVRDVRVNEIYAGWAIGMQGAYAVSVTGALIERVSGGGILVGGRYSTLSLDDVTIREVGRSFISLEEEGGEGVRIFGGASLEATNLRIEDTALRGILLSDAGPSSVTDTTIEGAGAHGIQVARSDAALLVRVTVTGGNGGIDVSQGSGATLRDTEIVDVHEVGVQIHDEGTVAELDTVTIRGTRVTDFGRGLRVMDGAVVAATDVVVEDSEFYGVEVDDGDLEAVGLRLSGNAMVGVIISGESGRVVLQDAEILDTRQVDALWGRGILVRAGAELVASDLLIEDSHDIGMLVSGAGSIADLTRVTIRGVADALGTATGTAIISQSNGRVLGLDVVIEDTEGPGAMVLTNGWLQVENAVIERATFAGVATISSTLDLLRPRIANIAPHPAEGGGVGLFSTRSEERITQVNIRAPVFEDLLGPAMYVVEVDDPRYHSYVMRHGTVRRTGGRPFPGGVFATGGTAARRMWTGEAEGFEGGLLIEGSTFEDIGGDAILLDRSGATLRLADDIPNSFASVQDEPLWVQRCGAEPVVIEYAHELDPSCRESPRLLGPVLQYDLRLREDEVVGR